MKIPEPEYLFVDGGYLRGVMNHYSSDYFGGEGFRPVLNSVFSGYRKTFYYDCLPAKRDSETDEEYEVRIKPTQDYFDQMRNLPGVHVIEGVLRGDRRLRQKRVDVAIAVHMLTHSYRRNMTRATLLAGDQDFLFLVEALVQDGLYLTLWFEDSSVAQELVMAADAQRKINLDNIWEFLPGPIQQDYPKPKEDSREKSNHGTAIKTGVDGYGCSVAVYEVGSEFVVAIDYTAPRDVEGLISHPKLDFLLAFAEYKRKGIDWTS